MINKQKKSTFYRALGRQKQCLEEHQPWLFQWIMKPFAVFTPKIAKYLQFLLLNMFM